MRWFTGHKIIKDEKGNTLVLYLDYALTEFASELGEIDRMGRKSLQIQIGRASCRERV